jgi:cell division protein FtsW
VERARGGDSLRPKRKHGPLKAILILMVVIIVVGLIVVYAIGPVKARFLNAVNGSSIPEMSYFWKQMISVASGLVLFAVAYFVPYEKIRKFAFWFWMAMVGVCVFMAIVGMAGGIDGFIEATNGAYRWIIIPNPFFEFSVQPAEFLKLGMLLYVAQILARGKREKTLNGKETLIPLGVVALVSIGLVAGAQSDLGTSLTMMVILAVMLVLSGMSWKILTGAVVLVAVLGVGLIATQPYRMERILTFLGDSDSAASHHIDNAMIAIGMGGFLGQGVGGSVQAAGYLPESLNDSVFAVVGEMFGFVGTLWVVVLFTLLAMKILGVGDRTVDDENQLITYGVFGWIAGHMTINIMAMTKLAPLTGITLPLLSTGGSSIWAILIVLGLVLQFSCYTNREVIRNEDIDSWRGIRRARNASHSSSSRNPKG